MQSWEAEVILGAEHITQVILAVRSLPNSSATASKLVDYYRLCTCGGEATTEPFFKLEGLTIMQNLL
jgi:hypothetical protein